VRQAADGEREIVTMSWGLMLSQNGRAPRPVTNVRDDTILKSSFWKSSFEQRRYLVPASSFCEPNGDVKLATWHWFSITGNEPRPLFTFPRHLAHIQRRDEERRPERRYRDLLVSDDDT
jgi:putative SOS response-associated peptidase YedK